ncbi:MAG TPA: nucleotide sugar dehydrogenase [Pilimelia sp.]|nr:nucleotide sugar dehydrogenase [Pilimelia sp.]
MSGAFDDRLAINDLVVSVIGLGYTGLPLALSFAAAGVPTIGFDLDQRKVAALGAGVSYLPDITDREVKSVTGNFTATTDPGVLSGADAYLICVPTPLADDCTADLRYVDSATDAIAASLRRGDLVIVQSTVPPGTTAAVAARLAAATGLAAGRDFHIAMVPERIDPAAGHQWTVRNTPKLVGGLTPECGRRAQLLFSRVVETVVPCASPAAAETAKVFENTFRLVNIALTYELADLCRPLGITPREVIDAAATKPFGFLAHFPGPGVGGECVPVDPMFLRTTAARNGMTMSLVETAHRHVRRRPMQVVDRLTELLRAEGSDLAGSRVLVVGVAYKPGVSDTRNAPGLDIIRELRRRAAKPRYCDPLVSDLVIDDDPVERIEWDRVSVSDHDCVVLVTPHEPILKRPLWYAVPLVLDTWHLLPGGDGVHHL